VSCEYLVLLRDEGIEVMDLKSFDVVNYFKQSNPICLSISAASDFLAVGFEDHIIRVFDLIKTRKEITMRGHSGKILQVKISPCSNFIASISDDLHLKVWSFPDFPEETTIPSSSKVTLIYFHGADLIVCKGDNKVYSYSEDLIELFEMKSTGMSAATFNTFLLVGDEIGFVYLFETQSKKLIIDIKAHNGAVRGLAINDKRVITGGADSEIYIWKVFDQLGQDLDLSSKVRLIGHQQAIWKIEMREEVLISGSADNTIRLWDLESLNEIGRINSTISAMAVGNQLVTGDFEGELRIWNLYDLDLESCISAHTARITGINYVNRFIFSSAVDGNVVVTSADYRVVYSKLCFKDAILSLHVNEKCIIIGFKNKMVIKNNSFFEEKIRVLGPVDLVQNFLLYIKELLLQRNPKHNPTMDQFLILPYYINTLHIYTYLCLGNYLTSSLENFSPLIANPFSPLCYSVYCDLKSIRGVLLNNIIQSGELNPYIFKLVEPHLVKMNLQGLDELYDLYEAAYMQVSRKYLPKTCSKEVKLPITKAVKYQRIQKEDFFNDDDLCEGVPLLYKENYLGIYMNLGSTKSLEFIGSLIKCPNPQVLRASFIQDMVKYKWEAAKFPMYIQTWMYYFYIITLSVYLQWFKRDFYCLTILVSTNLLLTIYEVFQMIVFKSYFSSVWNYLDWIRSFLFYGYAITEFTLLLTKDTQNTSQDNQSSIDDYILELLLVTSCIRGISYFRIFARTRYLIRLLQESIEGILGYFVFFSYFIIAFSIINYVNDIKLGKTPSQIEEIYQTYELALGSFYKNEEYDVAQWTVLTLISLILCIIIFNIMISLIGDSFEKVQTDSLSADTQELLEMIFEVENMIVTRRDRNFIYYFHFADNYFKDEVDSWEGRIRLLTKCFEKMSLKQRKQMREEADEFDKKTKNAVALERKLEKMAKLLTPSRKVE
jgi:WD40 repeat protein